MIKVLLLLSITLALGQVKTGSGGIWPQSNTNAVKTKRHFKIKNKIRENQEQRILFKKIEKALKEIKKLSKKTWFSCYKDSSLEYKNTIEFAQSLTKIIFLENAQILASVSKDNIYKTQCKKQDPLSVKQDCSKSKDLDHELKKLLALDQELISTYLIEHESFDKKQSADFIEVLNSLILINSDSINE